MARQQTKKAAPKKAAPAKSPTPVGRRKAPGREPAYGIVSGFKNGIQLGQFMGVGGVAVYSAGTQTYIVNPDPILRLNQTHGRGQRAYQDALDKDPHLAGVLDTRFNGAVSCPREVLPADESSLAGQMADTVTRVVDGIDNLDESCEELLYSRYNGFRGCEVEYELWSDGTRAIKALHALDPATIVFNVDGQAKLRTFANPNGDDLTERKFVVMRYKATIRNPYGVGLGRGLWWYHWFKREGLKFWLVAVEKFGQPTVVGKHPKTWTPTQQDELNDILASIASETGIRCPDDVELSLLEAVRGGLGTHKELVQFLDDSITKRVLGQVLTTEARNTGLNSKQANVQAEVRQDIKERDAKALERLLNETLVRWIVDFNYGVQDADFYPRLNIHAEPDKDLLVLAQTIGGAMDIGIQVPESWAREKLGIPEPQQGESVLNDLRSAQTQKDSPFSLGTEIAGGAVAKGEATVE